MRAHGWRVACLSHAPRSGRRLTRNGTAWRRPPAQTPAGLQQLQLDVAYLTPRLLAQLGPREAEALAALADEVVAAGAGRCLEPALLEPALLAKALAAASREG